MPALNAVREVPWAAWMTIQTGCDNSCAYCIVPSVRGGEVSPSARRPRRRGEPARRPGGREITLLGQNVNSYGRDLTRRRPLFAELLRAVGAVEGIDRHPLHQPAPEGPASRDHRGHGRDRGGLRAAPPAAAVGRDRVLTAMRRGYTRRALPRAAGGGPSRDRGPGGDHGPHRRLPRRDRRRLRRDPRGGRRGAVRQHLHLHLLAPPGDPGRRGWAPSSSIPTWSPSDSSAS